MRAAVALFGVAVMACALQAGGNPVERLDAKLHDGTARLKHDGSRRGYLMSLLEALEIDPASQMLVFSKTSLQMDNISPAHPRALYFNDEVSVGFVPYGNLLELATYDAERGVEFYALDADADPAKPLKLERRQRDCGSCHSTPNTPLVVQSVYPMANGAPFISLGTIMPRQVDHRTPFEERWGGWYVTGTHGRVRHMGNSLPADEFRPLDLTGPQNITALGPALPGKPDISPYPVPTSDLIALMTFEHQMYVTNGIAWLGRMYRNDREPLEAAAAAQAVEDLVQSLFFVDEAKLVDPIRGVSDFTAHFAERGPRDNRGRSLREFDLEHRLFRYPFSYMIYSPIFDSLPEAALVRARARINQVLNGNGGQRFAHLTVEDRTAIREILTDTKPSLFH